MPVDTSILDGSFEVGAVGSDALLGQVTISRIEHAGVPRSVEIFNHFDQLGLLLSLQRLPGERNNAYKARLLDVYTRRAGSTYRGMVNGITRELGLSFYDAFRIQVRRDGSGNRIGTNPVIEFDGPRVRIWADYTSIGSVELTIDRFDMSVEELFDAINASTVVEAISLSAAHSRSPAMEILNQISIVRVFGEVIGGRGQVIRLARGELVEGTLFFAGTSSFETEVDTPDAVNAAGRYWVDYQVGLLYTFDDPGPLATIRYQRLQEPMDIEASPVILHNTHDPLFREKLFEQVLQPDGTDADGLPTALGSNLINELLSVKGILYGR